MNTEEQRQTELRQILEEQVRTCEELYDYYLRENRNLRESADPLPGPMREEKEQYSDDLEKINFRLKELRQSGTRPGQQGRMLIDKAQKVMLKIFLLDRENERLLVPLTMGQRRTSPTRVAPHRLKSLYPSKTAAD